MPQTDLVGDRKSEPGSAGVPGSRRVGAVEPLEDVREILGLGHRARDITAVARERAARERSDHVLPATRPYNEALGA